MPLYFAKVPQVTIENGTLIPAAHDDGNGPTRTVSCRYRTLGCSPCTGAIESSASTVAEIIDEIQRIDASERANRVIDHDSDAAMEQKKQEGYF